MPLFFLAALSGEGHSLGLPDLRSDISLQSYATNEDASIIEGESGLKLIEGANLFLYLVLLGSKRVGGYPLEGFARVEKSENSLVVPLPLPSEIDQVSDVDRSFYTVGISVSYRFQR